MHLLSMKVAFMRSKKVRKLPFIFNESCIMLKHCKRQQFTQATYLHAMLNISKHFLGRNGGLLPTVCQAC